MAKVLGRFVLDKRLFCSLFMKNSRHIFWPSAQLMEATLTLRYRRLAVQERRGSMKANNKNTKPLGLEPIQICQPEMAVRRVRCIYLTKASFQLLSDDCRERHYLSPSSPSAQKKRPKCAEIDSRYIKRSTETSRKENSTTATVCPVSHSDQKKRVK